MMCLKSSDVLNINYDVNKFEKVNTTMKKSKYNAHQKKRSYCYKINEM